MKVSKVTQLIFCYISLCIVFAACSLKKVAGTSSGIDNPTLSIQFAKNSKKTSVTGNLNLYESTQNPLLEPTPKVSIPIQEKDSTGLSSENLFASAINALLKQKNTVITHFNIFIETPNGIEGAAIGLRFDPSDSSFYQNGEQISSPLEISLQDRQKFNGTINFDIPDVTAKYVYMLGTPYRSILNGNSFLLDSVAYELNLPLNVLGNDGYFYESPSLSSAIEGDFTNQDSPSVQTYSPVDIVDCDSLFLVVEEDEEDLTEEDEEDLYYLIEAHCEDGKDLVDSLIQEEAQ